MSDIDDPVVITGIARTALGGMLGAFAEVPAPQLGAGAIAGALSDSKIDPEAVDETLMGCVLPAGLGQAPARQASLGAGIPKSAGCTTINKMCGSGMKATMLAHDAVLAGSADVVVAGGMESMSRAPYLLQKARAGLRLGHDRVMDHMFLDGLEDAYEPGRLMGTYAEDCASSFNFTREEQDAYALESLARAHRAIEQGRFKREIVPFTISGRKGDTVIDTDEQPGNARPDKIPLLKPAFAKDGTVTPANSSSISDGAAALVLMRESEAKRRAVQPLARILGHSTHAQEPGLFTTAPVFAMNKLMDRLSWKANDIDLFEVNEAFAVVAMAAMRELNLPHDKVNVNGGACALGHPIGASGARILVTLLAALEHADKKRGLAGICIGGGEATAMAIERY